MGEWMDGGGLSEVDGVKFGLWMPTITEQALNAVIPSHHAEQVDQALKNNEGFRDTLQNFLSQNMQDTHKQLISDGDIQLSYGELPESHAVQVEFFSFCTCEDGPKVWDDCTQDGT